MVASESKELNQERLLSTGANLLMKRMVMSDSAGRVTQMIIMRSKTVWSKVTIDGANRKNNG